MIRAYPAAETEVVHRPLRPELALSDGVTTAVATLDAQGDMEVGVWEHSVGTSRDTEVEEVFVVLEGRGRVTCDEGGVIELAPGVVGLLPAGSRTTWEVTEPLRKVWITLQ